MYIGTKFYILNKYYSEIRMQNTKVKDNKYDCETLMESTKV